MRTLSHLETSGKTVLVQASLDVPIRDGVVRDDTRLRASIPTIRALLEDDCRVIVCGHIGRPQGRDPALSTKPVADRLQQLLGMPVTHITGVVGQAVHEAVRAVPQPGVAVLENLRYEQGEQAADEAFADELARLADAFVSDDFPSAHRGYACNTLLPQRLPSAAGLSMEREVAMVRHAVHEPKRPLTLIIGGAKADKIGVINAMLGIADTIIVGGVLANTFLKAKGMDIKESKYDERSVEIAGEFLREQEEKFLLPVDCVAAEGFQEDAEHTTCMIEEIPDGWMILDIGPNTIARYQDTLAQSWTVIWGGPIGVYEWEAFRNGTERIARFLAESQAYVLVGGGDSGDAVNDLGLKERMAHVSIGGGATLALIAGEELPALEALHE